MNDNKKLIIFYKSYILPRIHEELVKANNIITLKDVDKMLKEFARYNPIISCKYMSKDELNELIVWSFGFGDTIGLNLNFYNNEWEKIYDNEV